MEFSLDSSRWLGTSISFLGSTNCMVSTRMSLVLEREDGLGGPPYEGVLPTSVAAIAASAIVISFKYFQVQISVITSKTQGKWHSLVEIIIQSGSSPPCCLLMHHTEFILPLTKINSKSHCKLRSNFANYRHNFYKNSIKPMIYT